MVQIVPLQPAPNFGATLGQALSGRLERNLNLRLQDMLENKEAARKQAFIDEQEMRQRQLQHQQGKALAQYLGQPEEVGELIGSIGPDNFLKLMQQQLKQSEQSSLMGALSQISGLEPTTERPQIQQQQLQKVPKPSGIRTGMPSRLPFMKEETKLQEIPLAQQASKQETLKPSQEKTLSSTEFKKIYDSLPTDAAKKSALSAWREERKIAAAEKAQEFKEKAFEEKKIEPLRKDVESERSSIQGEESSLNLAEQALKMGGTSDWSQFLATRYDLDPLITPSSKLLSLASKEFLTGGLSNISAKGTNMFIEKRFLSMFPSIGSKEDSNESAIAALKRNLDVKKKKVELFDELQDRVPSNKLSSEIDKRLKTYTIHRNEKLAYDLSKIRDKYLEKKELKSLKKATPGDYLTQDRANALTDLTGSPEKAQKLAIKLGYKLPEEDLE